MKRYAHNACLRSIWLPRRERCAPIALTRWSVLAKDGPFACSACCDSTAIVTLCSFMRDHPLRYVRQKAFLFWRTHKMPSALSSFNVDRDCRSASAYHAAPPASAAATLALPCTTLFAHCSKMVNSLVAAGSLAESFYEIVTSELCGKVALAEEVLRQCQPISGTH